MGLYGLRFLLVVGTTLLGYYIGTRYLGPEGLITGTGVGLFAGVLICVLERTLSRVQPRRLVGGFVGLLMGLITARLALAALSGWPGQDPLAQFVVRALIFFIGGYLGLMLGVAKSREIEIPGLDRSGEDGGPETTKILDTSVIIDGRIADICEAGFLEGSLIIPQFVLKELQQIADSPDSLKRNRGRRGLDILQRMQKNMEIDIQFLDQDFPKIKEVDAKIVALAQELSAKVLTNDFNLNKVAELQGVGVLNINQLANAVKPVVLPGEMMNVYILKEGKEAGQGVAYLDDGTMVVVDNARRFIGKTIDVSVTSVLQTTAGRMIFTRPKEEVEREAS
ncbi:MAG: PIN domain-containing protein [bacterium]